MKNIQSRRDKPGTHDLRLEEAGNQHPSGSFSSMCHPFLASGSTSSSKFCTPLVRSTTCGAASRDGSTLYSVLHSTLLCWYVLYALVRRTTRAAHSNVSQASHHFFGLRAPVTTAICTA